MSSKRSINASRANGALSRGPVTPQGHERCQIAAITHGLASRRVVLDHESEADFHALRDMYVAALQPQTPLEIDLVEQLVAARWRVDRAWAVETALLDVTVVRQKAEVAKEFTVCDPETRTAFAFQALADDSRAFTALSRYESRFRRICDKLLKTLLALRENGKLREGPNPNNEHPESPAPLEEGAK
jgi:hypothetical protein